MVDLKQCVQRELNFAIVDEVDNILIDDKTGVARLSDFGISRVIERTSRRSAWKVGAKGWALVSRRNSALE